MSHSKTAAPIWVAATRAIRVGSDVPYKKPQPRPRPDFYQWVCKWSALRPA
ncbi:hypothetical protein [Dietzia sp. UBA5065]|uniref:hypothetical protein n=1 Tax=Dietzia sp. UBA5065 TaxID=1946422 RepID=UPI0025C366B9|nr:hypothetical protein [Dietzia sp. UBA5065]